MKKLFKYIFTLTFIASFGQTGQNIDTIGVDIYDSSYILKGNTLFKESNTEISSYENFNFGKVSSVDIINPFEVVLFYDEFDTTIILDKELNLIQTINFANNISFSRKAITDKIWIYNEDENKVQLYDYKSKSISISSQILTGFTPTKMESNFNTVKLTSNKKTYVFNQYLYLEDTINH